MQRLRALLITVAVIAFALAALRSRHDDAVPGRARVTAASPERVAPAQEASGMRAVTAAVQGAARRAARQSPPSTSADNVDIDPIPIRQAIDSGQAQPVFLSLVAPAQIHAGERFIALVNAETENDVARMLLTLRFDRRRLRVVSAHAGDFMRHAGAQFEFSYSEEPSSGGITLEIAEDPMGPPIAGGGTVASVEFQAIAGGETEVALDRATMFDLRNEGVAYSLAAASRVAIVP